MKYRYAVVEGSLKHAVGHDDCFVVSRHRTLAAARAAEKAANAMCFLVKGATQPFQRLARAEAETRRVERRKAK